jgi:hypothetical protein
VKAESGGEIDRRRKKEKREKDRKRSSENILRWESVAEGEMFKDKTDCLCKMICRFIQFRLRFFVSFHFVLHVN